MYSQLSMLNVNSFTMGATKPSSVTVMCSQELQPTDYYYWFTFKPLQTVNISDITFNGCNLQVIGSSGQNNVVFERSSFVNNTCCGSVDVLLIQIGVSVVQIKQCIFSDNKGTRTIIYNNAYNITVDQTTFKNNSAYGYTNSSSRSLNFGGGAIFHAIGYIKILNSTFRFNEIANNFDGGAIYIDSGTNGITVIADSYFSEKCS